MHQPCLCGHFSRSPVRVRHVRHVRLVKCCSRNAEIVYKLENDLQTAGFTQQQARTLLLTSTRLQNIKRNADFSDVNKVFEASWEIEDAMMALGLPLKRARHIGCLFIGLAATEFQDRGYHAHEPYWNHWEVDVATQAGEHLEKAGANGSSRRLAQAMLNFVVFNRRL